ncbi:hypothetical protein VaNZ11_000111 [Volvox africanus]|uniref:VWFA domain-containing protein n=1 Tax=Volvox africanus TaxID=51714 RepID=A0ABQ5RLN1_9CHLO|nr:hypothetical protein VaNZ11_000111 [Volvox africanus]
MSEGMRVFIRKLFAANFEARPRPQRTSLVQTVLVVAVTPVAASSAQPQDSIRVMWENIEQASARSSNTWCPGRTAIISFSDAARCYGCPAALQARLYASLRSSAIGPP